MGIRGWQLACWRFGLTVLLLQKMIQTLQCFPCTLLMKFIFCVIRVSVRGFSALSKGRISSGWRTSLWSGSSQLNIKYLFKSNVNFKPQTKSFQNVHPTSAGSRSNEPSFAQFDQYKRMGLVMEQPLLSNTIAWKRAHCACAVLPLGLPWL